MAVNFQLAHLLVLNGLSQVSYFSISKMCKNKKQELHGSGPNAKNCWVALKLAEAAAVVGRNRRRE